MRRLLLTGFLIINKIILIYLISKEGNPIRYKNFRNVQDHSNYCTTFWLNPSCLGRNINGT